MAQQEEKDRWTLEELKKAYTENGIDGLEPVVKKFFDQKDFASKIIGILNNLIQEYNRAESKNEYKKSLFEMLEISVPFLDVYTKGIAFVNLCILADDKYNRAFYDEYFNNSLKQATEYIQKILELIYDDIDFDIYFTLGFLNFKAQKYNEAIHFLENSLKSFNSQSRDPDEIAQLMECRIYLANSYEYNKKLPEALEVLWGIRESDLKNNIEEKQNKIVNCAKDISEKISRNSCEIDDIKALYEAVINKGNKGNVYAVQIFDLYYKEETKKELVKSFIHVLAHCMSEFAAQKTNACEAEYPYCSLLQYISKIFMDWLVAIDDSYITCSATIRAENDACPEAINLLLSRYEEKYGNVECEEENKELAKAELEFYIFYFAEQELRYNHEDKELEGTFLKFGTLFRKYSEGAVSGHTDYDSLFHYWVIQCKYLLKKYANEVLKKGKRTSVNYQEIDVAFLQLYKCKRKISRHVFKELITTYEQLQKLYTYFRQFRYLNSNDKNRYNLREFKTLLVSDKKMNLNKIYDYIERRNKILILAPVYEAPACSFSVKNFDELINFQQKESAKWEDSEEDVKKAFEKIMDGHRRISGKTSMPMSTKNKENKAKWAFFYNDRFQTAYLFYRNFRKSDSRNSDELFPIILNEKERETLIALLKILGNELKAKEVVDCGCHQEEDDPYGCITRVINYDSEDAKAVSRCLLNLSIFLEMDIISNENEMFLSKNDHIIFNISDTDAGCETKITVLPSDFELETEEVCEWCKFQSNNSEKTHRESVNWSESYCKKVDFGRTIAKLQSKYTPDGGTGLDITLSEDIKKLNQCANEICVDTKNRSSDKPCALLKGILDRWKCLVLK